LIHNPEELLYLILTLLKIQDSEINLLINETLKNKNFFKIDDFLNNYSFKKVSSVTLDKLESV
jgi:hypothetical protein